MKILNLFILNNNQWKSMLYSSNLEMELTE